MAASGKAGWEELFEPKVPGFPKVPLGDIAAVEAAIGPNTVAVMLEPIQGEAGVLPAGDDYLQALRKLTEERGVLLILDEIQTGMGRTGRLFAYQHTGIRPDILTLGKGLGGGLPLAALLAREDVCCFAGRPGRHLQRQPADDRRRPAVLETLSQPGFLDQVAATGRHLAAGLAPCGPPRLRRGAGPRPAAGPRPETAARPDAGRGGAGAGPADQRAPARVPALHAGADGDAGRGRPDAGDPGPGVRGGLAAPLKK